MRRPIFHPLSNAKLITLVRMLVAHGVSPRYVGYIPLMVLASLLGGLNSAVEGIRVARRVKRVTFDPPPVFIVGHWRSGTTYLHNLMSRDPAFCFPTLLDTFRPYEFFYRSPGEMISRFILLRSLPPTRVIDDVPNRPDLPQEDEWALAAMGGAILHELLLLSSRTSRHVRPRSVVRGADTRCAPAMG